MDDEIEAHSSLGPSGAHRYRRCPGAPALEAQVPNRAGIEAAYGTCFHEAAAICLEFGIEPEALIGMEVRVEEHGLIEFTKVMAQYMQPGIDYVRALVGPGDLLLVERRVNLEPWLGPNQFGTADVAIISVERFEITVFDWKYGAGVPVSPIENDQAILYFAGVWNDYAGDIFEPIAWQSGVDPADADFYEAIKVQIVIEQPRAPGGGGIWTTTVGALLRRLDEIREDAAKTYLPDAPRIAGDIQCKFCSGKPYCREYADLNLSHFDLALTDVEADFEAEAPILLPKAVSPEARSQILLHRSQIEAWLKDLHAEAYKDAEDGLPVPGMKLVEGRRGARSWKDEGKASVVVARYLGDDAFTKKLLSPAQVEETVGKAEYKRRYEGFAMPGDAKPALVPDKDYREARANKMERFDAALEAEDDNLI